MAGSVTDTETGPGTGIATGTASTGPLTDTGTGPGTGPWTGRARGRASGSHTAVPLAAGMASELAPRSAVLAAPNVPKASVAARHTAGVQRRPLARVAGCSNARVAGYPHARVAGCPHARVAGCPHTRVAGYPHARVAGCPHARLAGCPSGSRWVTAPPASPSPSRYTRRSRRRDARCASRPDSMSVCRRAGQPTRAVRTTVRASATYHWRSAGAWGAPLASSTGTRCYTSEVPRPRARSAACREGRSGADSASTCCGCADGQKH